MLDIRPAGVLPMLHAFADADLTPVLPHDHRAHAAALRRARRPGDRQSRGGGGPTPASRGRKARCSPVVEPCGDRREHPRPGRRDPASSGARPVPVRCAVERAPTEPVGEHPRRASPWPAGAGGRATVARAHPARSPRLVDGSGAAPPGRHVQHAWRRSPPGGRARPYAGPRRRRGPGIMASSSDDAGDPPSAAIVRPNSMRMLTPTALSAATGWRARPGSSAPRRCRSAR